MLSFLKHCKNMEEKNCCDVIRFDRHRYFTKGFYARRQTYLFFSTFTKYGSSAVFIYLLATLQKTLIVPCCVVHYLRIFLFFSMVLTSSHSPPPLIVYKSSSPSNDCLCAIFCNPHYATA